MNETQTGARLLWITDRYPPLGGGMAESCLRQATGLRRRGVRVDVMAFTSRDPRLVVRAEPRDNGTDFHFSRTARPGLTAQQAWRTAADLDRREPYDRVVGFGADRSGFLAVTFAAWMKVPSLVLVRGNDFDQHWFDPAHGSWVREALARADRIGVVAPDLGDRIRALFPGRDVRFIPNGLDPSAWDLLAGDERVRDETRAKLNGDGRRVIGLFGELKYKKGVPFWLGALRDTGLMDRAALLVVGKRMDEEIRQLLDDPALAPPNLQLPFAGRDKLVGLYAACDYVALPSLFEGMPNVLLEAMGMGIVPIVSDAGAMAELVRDGETGFIFPVMDRERAAEATARALRQTEEERRAMGLRAKDRITREFSLDREVEVLLEALDLGAKG